MISSILVTVPFEVTKVESISIVISSLVNLLEAQPFTTNITLYAYTPFP